MSGISKKRFRKPNRPGNWHFGRGNLPKSVTDELGAGMAEWGYVEQRVDALLGAAVDAPQVGKIIRKNLHTPKRRHALLKEMIVASAEPDIREKVLAILGEFSALSLERALYAHGVWGFSEGHPEEALLLMDDTVFEVSFISADAVAAKQVPNMEERMRNSVALVSVRDLQRFRLALKRCSDRSELLLMELMDRSLQKRIQGHWLSRPSADRDDR